MQHQNLFLTPFPLPLPPPPPPLRSYSLPTVLGLRVLVALSLLLPRRLLFLFPALVQHLAFLSQHLSVIEGVTRQAPLTSLITPYSSQVTHRTPTPWAFPYSTKPCITRQCALRSGTPSSVSCRLFRLPRQIRQLAYPSNSVLQRLHVQPPYSNSLPSSAVVTTS